MENGIEMDRERHGRNTRKAHKAKRKTLCQLGKTFQWCKRSDKMLGALQDAALRHAEYQHYLKCEHLEKMILGDKMLLRRGSSSALDDWRESEKYGDPKLWDRTYLACFCHEREENAAFWWMYGQGHQEALRVTFPLPVLRLWVKKLKLLTSVDPFISDENERKLVPGSHVVVGKPFVTDIGYVSIHSAKGKRQKNGDENGTGVRAVSWDGLCRHFADLDTCIKTKEATGRFKDYEWRFERETRLLVEIGDSGFYPDQIVVSLDWTELSKAGRFTITAGPWMPQRRFDEMKIRFEALFRAKGLSDKGYSIERSSLLGALNFRN